jgi:hypothetical protein
LPLFIARSSYRPTPSLGGGRPSRGGQLVSMESEQIVMKEGPKALPNDRSFGTYINYSLALIHPLTTR